MFKILQRNSHKKLSQVNQCFPQNVEWQQTESHLIANFSAADTKVLRCWTANKVRFHFQLQPAKKARRNMGNIHRSQKVAKNIMGLS